LNAPLTFTPATFAIGSGLGHRMEKLIAEMEGRLPEPE
jgi:hypothetical protein